MEKCLISGQLYSTPSQSKLAFRWVYILLLCVSRKHGCTDLASAPKLDSRGRGCTRVCGRFFFFFFLTQPDYVWYSPIWSETVRNRTRFRLIWANTVQFGSIWAKILVKKNYQYTPFCWQTLKETTLKSSQFSLCYLLLLLNWYMFTIIWKKNA